MTVVHATLLVAHTPTVVCVQSLWPSLFYEIDTTRQTGFHQCIYSTRRPTLLCPRIALKLAGTNKIAQRWKIGLLERQISHFLDHENVLVLPFSFSSRTIHNGRRVHPSTTLFFFVVHVVTFLATGTLLNSCCPIVRSRSQSIAIRAFPLQGHSQYLLPRKFGGNMFQSVTTTSKKW